MRALPKYSWQPRSALPLHTCQRSKPASTASHWTPWPGSPPTAVLRSLELSVFPGELGFLRVEPVPLELLRRR